MDVEGLYSKAELQFRRGPFIHSEDPETEDANLKRLWRHRGSMHCNLYTIIPMSHVVTHERCIWEELELCDSLTIQLELGEAIFILLSIVVDVHF